MNNGISEWRCEHCNRLLGTYKDKVICIQIREHQYAVEDGRVTTVCPNSRCRHLNIKVLTKDVSKV